MRREAAGRCRGEGWSGHGDGSDGEENSAGVTLPLAGTEPRNPGASMAGMRQPEIRMTSASNCAGAKGLGTKPFMPAA